MKNSTKECGSQRIANLQSQVRALQESLHQSQVIEQEYNQQTARLQLLEEKVYRSEHSRRVLSDKIQTIKGNLLSHVILWTTPGLTTPYIVDAHPNGTSMTICSSTERSTEFTVNLVHSQSWQMDDIVSGVLDYLYMVLDGRSLAVLNMGMQELASTKRHFFFSDQSSSFVYQMITVLMGQTQRLAPLQQLYTFSLSAIALPTDQSNGLETYEPNMMDVSVSESYIAECPKIIVDDLLEIGRFSMGIQNGQQTLKQRRIQTVEDVANVLEVVSRHGVERGKTVIVTL